MNITLYKHEETILRFTDLFDISYDESSAIFEDMIKFLMLLNRYQDKEYVFTHEPLWIIDEMWHTFLLYSSDYREFCLKHFGRMIDHRPTIRSTKLDIINGLEDKDHETVTKVSKVVKKLYELIHDYLGKETLIRWLKYYGETYTIEYVNSIRKPIL